MNIRQKSVKAVAWTAAQSWGGRIVSFIVLLVLARLLQPKAFGLLAYASVYIAFVEILIEQGFGDAIVQCPQIEREHLDTAFWISLIISIIMTGIGVLASKTIAQLFNEPQLAPIVSWLSLDFILSALSSVQLAILRRRLDFKSIAIRSLLATVFSGGIAIILAFLGFGVWSLVAKVLVVSLVSAITLWKISDWRPGIRISLNRFKELFSYGINIVGSNVANFLSLHGDDFLIGYFLGSVALGYYTLAYNLLIVLSDLLITVPNLVIFPAFSRIQSDHEKMKQSFYEVTKLQSTIAFPIFLGVSVLAPEIIILLYGKTWAPSIPVLQILMLMGVFNSAFYLYSSVMKAVGKPSWRLGLWSLNAMLNLLGFFLVVRRGIVAVAAVYVLIGYMLWPLYLFIVKKLIHASIWVHIKQYFPAVFSSLPMITSILILKYLLNDRFVSTVVLFVCVLSGAAIYLLTLCLIQPKLFSQLLEIANLTRHKMMPKKA